MANVFIQRFKSFFLNFCTIFYVFKGFKNFFETFFYIFRLNVCLCLVWRIGGLNRSPLSTPLLFPSLSLPFLSFCPFPLKVKSLESRRSEGAL